MLLDHNCCECTVLGFNTVHWRLTAFFLFTWSTCASPLSRSIYCRVYKVNKLEEIVDKTFINCWVLQLVIAGKLLCSIPTWNCVIYPDYTTMVHQHKRLVFQLWIYSINRYPIPSVKENLVLLVLFLGNLMHYTETNRNKYK